MANETPTGASAPFGLDRWGRPNCCPRSREHPKGDPTMMVTCHTAHRGIEVAGHWNGRTYVCGLCALDDFHAAVEPTLSPDAAEQGPPADGPIVTPELRRAVVAAAHAESVSRGAHERVDALRAAADLDMSDPHTYAPDTRYAAAHDAQPAPAPAPAVDPVAAIVDLIEQYGVARADAARAAITDTLAGEAPQRRRTAADLLDRIRRTLADALDTRRHRERYAVLVAAGGRPVVCPCGYGVFDSCPNCDQVDEPAAAVEQPAAWRPPLGPQVVAALIRIANAGGLVLASALPGDIASLMIEVGWVELVGPKTVGLMDLRLTEAGEEAAKVAAKVARQSS